MAQEDVARDAVRRALALLGDGDWDGAHAIAQRHEGVPVADWLHAVLHTIEGDTGNARYWYARAGRAPHAFASPEAELLAIAAALG